MTTMDDQYTTNKESWSQYQLDDGTILKLKIVLVRVLHDVNQKKIKGQERMGFAFGMQNVVAAIPNKKFPNKKPTSKDNVSITGTISVGKNEYTIDKGEYIGTKIIIEPKVTSVSRTDKLNSQGEPIYNVQISPAVTIKMKKSKAV
ncbi:MAG: hypothetical protein NTZ37_00055 [Methanoregula sp.]|nr:hypothetical protein [Methanoregula sp.]